MNIDQMHIGINIGVQKVAANVLDDFLPQEIDYYLNNSITEFVKQQYTMMKNEDRSVEGQYVNENLRTITVTTSLSNLAVVNRYSNAVSADLPANYKYYVFSLSRLSNVTRTHRLVQPKGIKDYIQTSTNRPLFREFPVLIENDKLILIGDSRVQLIQSNNPVPELDIHLTYLRNPAVINFTAKVDCDLPDHTHKQIVDMTIDQILTDVKSLRPPQPDRRRREE